MAKIEFTAKEFQELKRVAEEEYKKIGQVYCPFLKNRVSRIYGFKGKWDLEGGF